MKYRIEKNFKKTEIGLIPVDWDSLFIKDICFVKNGKTNVQDSEENGEFPLFDRSNEVKKSNKYLFDTEAIIIPGEGKEFSPKYYKGKFDLHQRAYMISSSNLKKINLKFVYYWIKRKKDF